MKFLGGLLAFLLTSGVDSFALMKENGEHNTFLEAASLLQDSTKSNTMLPEDDNDLALSIGNWEHDHQGLNPKSYPTKEALKLVHQLAKRLSKSQPDVQDDLVQEGVVALMHAINSYPILGRRESFQKYAKRHIILQMSKSMDGSLNRLAPTVAFQLKSAKRIRQALSEKLHRQPSISEVAHRLEISPDELERYELFEKNAVSVESTLETDDPDKVNKVFTDQELYDRTHSTRESDVMWEQEDEEQVWLQPTASLKDLIVDKQELTPEDIAFQAMIQSDVDSFVSKALDDVELQVIRMRYGLQGEALSLKEIAKRLRTTKHFVETLESVAIQKLRSSYGSRYIEPYL